MTISNKFEKTVVLIKKQKKKKQMRERKIFQQQESYYNLNIITHIAWKFYENMLI